MTTAISDNSSILPLVNPQYSIMVYTAATATGLAALGMFVPVEAIRIIALTVLTGVTYGITNDMFACRDCIEYFTVGHFYDERNLEHRPLNTLDPNLNAIAWGSIATWHVSAIAGAFFAFFARFPISDWAIKITTAELAPYLFIGAAVALFLSHVVSRVAGERMAVDPFYRHWDVPLNLQSGWEACNARNLTGYASLGLGGTILSVSIIAIRMGLII